MRIYIIGNDGITLCREPPATVNKGEIAVASREELHAARLSGKRLLALWNALPGVEKQTKVGDRDTLIDQLWYGLAAAHGPGALLRSFEEEARADPRLGDGGARPGLPHRRAGAGMSRAIQDTTGCREALARLPKLGLRELRQHWRVLYKAEASPHLSRELLLRAVAYRMQEVALGSLRPQRQRQLRQFARQLNDSQEGRVRPRSELKPGTRLVREWQGRTYEVLVLDDGLSWQGTSYRSLSALARKITGTAWSGPLFFGLKANRTAALKPSRGPGSAGVDGDAAG